MIDPSQQLSDLLKRDKRYRYEAYAFVFEALSYAQNILGLGADGDSEPSDFPDPEDELELDEDDEPQQHVTGQELCEAIRQYAVEQYGFMAKIVLGSWGIHRTDDFGNIVFNLIEIGQMRKTKHDRQEDFNDVYDFEHVFHREFKIEPSR